LFAKAFKSLLQQNRPKARCVNKLIVVVFALCYDLNSRAGRAMADKIFINYRRDDSIGMAGAPPVGTNSQFDLDGVPQKPISALFFTTKLRGMYEG
jgi:hypothetical protein